MINLLNSLLFEQFKDTLSSLRTPKAGGGYEDFDDSQISFDPPDEKWRGSLRSAQRNALNIYLVDLRENRKLRSNEQTRETRNGLTIDTPSPVRVDCHYLLSAWSPLSISPQVKPTLDEHLILYEAASVLFTDAFLNPSRIYPAGSTALQAWGAYADTELPFTVLPPEGFPKLAEFWGTMGHDHPWKPVVYFIVTIPVIMPSQFAGYQVTTTITDAGQIGIAGSAEELIQIGGRVINARVSPSQMLANAWVQLATETGESLQTEITNGAGQFIFGNLRPGRYQLRTRAIGVGELTPPRMVDVPSPSGEYDLIFT